MPDTLQSIALAVALILPGFVIADLAETRRATRAARSDLELVLRGLVYALILQGVVALTGWTAQILDAVDAKDGWQPHLTEISVYALVVGILIPTVLGLVLSAWLREAEQEGRLRAWHYALGGRDHREAWDFVFGRQEGAYLLLTVSEAGEARHLLAKYGPRSWSSQAPTHPQELYVEAVWPADSNGTVAAEIVDRDPPRGMWNSADKIERIEHLRLPPPKTDDE
jgi:hypothetical protein